MPIDVTQRELNGHPKKKVDLRVTITISIHRDLSTKYTSPSQNFIPCSQRHLPPTMSSTYNLPYRGLPAEIRLKIWRYCLTKTLWYCRHRDFQQGPFLATGTSGLHVAIFRLDKRTHEEAKQAMAQSIWLGFLNTSAEEIIRLLRRISPSLSHWYYSPGNRTTEGMRRQPLSWALPNRQRLNLIRGISISWNVSPVAMDLFLLLARDSPIKRLIIRRRVERRRFEVDMTCRSFISTGNAKLVRRFLCDGALKSLGFEICGFTQQELVGYDHDVLEPFEEWASGADLSMTHEPSWNPEGENLLLNFVKK